ncbi:MAG: hypothetical protein IJQ09_04240 [Prevotella sp.]|nr:hypothetical protein [Prevotella sp.]MBR0187777.1 hypothetical protein [Prevotella sp.]
MNTKQLYFSLFVGGMLLSACTQHDEALETDDDRIIHVGGVTAGDVLSTSAVTRAMMKPVAAESLDWLKKGLSDTGMDITYFTKTAQQKALLKLQLDSEGNPAKSEGGITIYDFKAYNNNGELTDVAAKWLGNGAHTFQGKYIPESLKSSGTHSYEDLEHYTAIPPSTSKSATVGRITIPIQHRLARVQAYVLIDTDMKAKLKGYADDPENVVNTKLRFCNVDVLDCVKDGKPVWKTATKAVPHYIGELGSIVENDSVAFPTFRTYKNTKTGELLFPTDGEWKTAHDLYEIKGKKGNSGYTCTDYGKVPSYDLAVRPTYTEATTGTNVMYDEATTSADGENQIRFDLTLDNDLEYEKVFKFDLNANEETVVFLRITPEKIDYNSSGSRLWKSVSHPAKYYDLDTPDHSLSQTGSSWQRAFTNETEGFVDLLKQAYEGGAHHGDYFVLTKDIEINLNDFPADLVFTGHLDAMGHTITLIPAQDGRDWLFAGMNANYTTAQETDSELEYSQWEANVHKEKDNLTNTDVWVPLLGYRAEVMNAVVTGGTLFKQ